MINLQALSSYTNPLTKPKPTIARRQEGLITASAEDYRRGSVNGHHPNRVPIHLLTTPREMQRIIIIGSSGSGKSTLARTLGRQLGIDVVHLDQHFWHPGWIPTDEATWTKSVQAMVQAPSWIIDGNYRRTLDIRLQQADTIIFLDMPRLICMWRAFRRRLQYAFDNRPDIASGCDEQIFDPSLFSFLRRIWNYPNRARPDVLQRLHQLHSDQQLFWLRTTGELNYFLATQATPQADHRAQGIIT